MLVAALSEVNTPIETKSVPLPIQFMRAMINDRVAPRLGQDAFTVGVVLVDLMDRLHWRPVGFYMSQLCDACGFPSTNPRRARAARAALMSDGWLLCDIPKNGDRTQAVYEMVMKTTPANLVSDLGKNGSGKQLTPNQNGGGEELTPAKTVASPQPNRYPTPANLVSDPGQNGPPSNPTLPLHTPSTSSNTNPPNPPEAEVFVLESSGIEKQSPDSEAVKPKTAGAVSEIQTTLFPESLQSAEFTASWDSWLKHRKELRKPMTPTSAAKQLARLAEMGEDRATSAIDHSIANGYQGIFEPGANGGKGGDFFSGIRDFANERGVSDMFEGQRAFLARHNANDFYKGAGEHEAAAIETAATSSGSESYSQQGPGDVWRPWQGA